MTVLTVSNSQFKLQEPKQSLPPDETSHPQSCNDVEGNTASECYLLSRELGGGLDNHSSKTMNAVACEAVLVSDGNAICLNSLAGHLSAWKCKLVQETWKWCFENRIVWWGASVARS